MRVKSQAVAVYMVLGVVITLMIQNCTRQLPSGIDLPDEGKAKIIFIVGEVMVKQPSERSWSRAEMGDVLGEGVFIQTGRNSYCEIMINSGTVFRMKQESKLKLVALPEGRKDNRTSIRHLRGEILAKVHGLAYRDSMQIQTDAVTMRVKGTELLVSTLEAEHWRRTELLVKEGRVRASLNIKNPSSDSLSWDLRRVLRRIQNGQKVDAGSKLVVYTDQVDRVNDAIHTLVKQIHPSDQQINTLYREMSLKPVPFNKSDLERVEEIAEISPGFQLGRSYYLSPNFDDRNDEFVFNTQDFLHEKIYGWRLVFTDGNSNPVQVIKSRGHAEQKLTRLPREIKWNLTASDGSIVEDGSYVYKFYTLDKHHNKNLRRKGIIVSDTTPPVLEVSAENMVFSPNEDGVKDTIKINVRAEGGHNWSCEITTQEGITVGAENWEGDIPEVFEWDGISANQNLLPDGVYNITFTGFDRAGNKIERKIEGITLDTRERKAFVNADHDIISPNGDGKLDRITFHIDLSDWRRVDTWDLVIQADKGRELRGRTVRRFRGRRWVPKKVVWGGTPKEGNLNDYVPDELPSGRYFYFLKVIYVSGVNTYSFKKDLILDIDPPVVDIEVAPKVFTPDGDGNDDRLVIKPRIQDLTPVHSWKAFIYTSEGEVFKTFSGVGPPGTEIVWDGVSDSGTKVSSGEEYYVVFEATDSAFNTAETDKVPFSVGILVLSTDRGWKIRVSNVEFGFDNAVLKGQKTFRLLDEVVSILKKYGKYSIIIEGHTDSTGEEDYNIQLSEKRARAVGKYLVENGIDEQRLSYQGYGAKHPVDTNKTAQGRARNRRVEFILVRD
ncbi:MAG: OmpA family protein [Spirochaetota bacterium]